MHSFKQLESVIDISLQPGTNGNVFAAICCDDVSLTCGKADPVSYI